MIDISKLSIKSARQALRNKEFSSRELTQTCLDVIKEKDGDIHAFLEVFDDALNRADEDDEKIKRGEDLPLLGIPIAIKDNILISGRKATAGSKILAGFVAPYDATAIKKLKSAGAILLGRTNMDEFGMGTSTEDSAYGPTKNPYDTTRVAGGSSGGSAATVAADMALGAFGSDTGGSCRQPAALCGVVGFKPTYGRVSRSGLIALGSSLDQIGEFGKTVGDVEVLYNTVRGLDPLDSTSITDDTYKNTRKFKKIIGIPRSFVESDGVSKEVKDNFKVTEKKFQELGYQMMDIDLPHLKYSLAAYYIILPAEISSNLARFDGVKYGSHMDGVNSIDDYFKTRGAGFGVEARRRIILGTYVLSSGYYDAYYGRAVQVKRLITDEVKKAFEGIDLILTPTIVNPAFKIGDKISDPLSMYLEDIFTVPANITGCPAISLPSGFAGDLPLGIELTADLGREDNLFIAGKEFLGE